METTTYNIFSAICVTRRALTRIADKWTILVLAALAEQPYHFGELRRKIECISQKMLTQTLRKLEADGLIARDVESGAVTKVIYSLTPLGLSLVEPLESLQRWAITHADELEKTC
jgi:DNA-binding HxlR family transcriptional regulator